MKIEEAIKSTKEIELPSKLLINLMYTSRYVEYTVNHFKEAGITSQQYNVLRILRGQRGNPANMSTLQERMIDKNSNTTRLVDKLISKELVKRQVCAQNRRKIEIFITKTGLSLLEQLDPIIKEHNQRITKNLNKSELENLSDLLDKLRND